MEHGDVSLLVTFPDGGTLSDRPVLLSDITLEGYTTLELPGIGEEQRARMRGGYTIAVDPLGLIEETHDDNNEYVVPAGARLRLVWTQITTHYYPYYSSSDSPQEQTFNVQVRVGPYQGYYTSLGPAGRTTVAELTHGPFEVERYIEGGPWDGMSLGSQGVRVEHEVEFEIAGDEYLYVFADATMTYRWHDAQGLGHGAASTSPGSWGADRTISADEECYHVYLPYGTLDHHVSVQPPWPWRSCGEWAVHFMICRVE